MTAQQAIFRFTALAAVIGALIGAPSAMAGAYDTGEGHGYASYASTEFLPKGTIFYAGRILPDARLTLCKEINQLRRPLLFHCIFGPIAYCLQGRKI